MSIGKRIKELRKSINMTQEELGELLGVKKAAVQKYENETIINLKIDTLRKLSEIFEVAPSYIMGCTKFDDEYDLDKIKEEIKFIESLEDKQREIFLMIKQLNDEGINKILTVIEDLNEIPKYKSQDEFKMSQKSQD